MSELAIDRESDLSSDILVAGGNDNAHDNVRVLAQVYLASLAERARLGQFEPVELAVVARMTTEEPSTGQQEDELRWDVVRAADRLRHDEEVSERHLALWGLVTIVKRPDLERSQHLAVATLFAHRLHHPAGRGELRFQSLWAAINARIHRS